jgi:hypothetical protein
MPNRLIALVFVAACGGTPEPAVVDAPTSSDAAVDTPVVAGDCSTGEHVTLQGAFALDVASAAVVTLSDKVIGVGGAPTPGTIYTLSVRRPTMTDLDAVGVHDVATTNLKYLTGTGCSTAGACSGFFALGGTVTVTETSPRYRATFTLTDLYHHDDTSDQLGAPIAGTITGCVNANR